jgi:hypothetical protein
MHVLVIMALASAELADAIATAWPALGLIKFTPEVLSLIIAIWVLMEGVRRGFSVSPKYWLAFGLVVFIIVCGVVTNSVGAGPVFAGMRSYLRAVPLFLVPAVFAFTDKQIQQQAKAVLALAMLQVPVASYQRYVIMAAHRYSGDDVRGTVMDSGILSIMLICIALVLVGLFMRKQLTKAQFFPLFFLTLLPTTINETKATVVLLPIGLLTTIVAGSPRGQRLRIFGLGVSLLLVFGAVLIPVYDYMETYNPYKHERSLVDFFTKQEEFDRYMNAKGRTGIGSTKPVRRGDAIKIPLQYLAHDPVTFAFGLGFGNASHSNLGQNFVGTYNDLFKAFVVTSFAVFLLEIGVFGVVLVFVLYALQFFDAVALSRSPNDLHASIAIGWIGIVAVMAAATFYTPIHIFPTLSYLYWYFGGVVAFKRYELARSVSSSVTPTPVLRSHARVGGQ